MEIPKRYRGCLLGLAVGDALGDTLELQAPGTFRPITDMVGGGPFGLKPGQWTDDTSMALCLAESLIRWQGFDPVDQLERYCKWYRNGYLSSTGVCFDIGTATRRSLELFERTREPFPGLADPTAAGNGSLMRLAPVPLFFAREPRLAIEKAAQSSRTTHGAVEAMDACRYFAGLIIGALQGIEKERLLSSCFSPVRGLWNEAPLHSKVAEVAAGSFKERNPPEIRASGYVVVCLEAALWAFYRSTSFQQGALFAVALGEDADTTAAVYGQLAGAFYGEQGIPVAWRSRLAEHDRIEAYANALLSRSIDRRESDQGLRRNAAGSTLLIRFLDRSSWDAQTYSRTEFQGFIAEVKSRKLEGRFNALQDWACAECGSFSISADRLRSFLAEIWHSMMDGSEEPETDEVETAIEGQLSSYFLEELLELLESRDARRPGHGSSRKEGNDWPAYLEWLHFMDEDNPEPVPHENVIFWINQECPSCRSMVMARRIDGVY